MCILSFDEHTKTHWLTSRLLQASRAASTPVTDVLNEAGAALHAVGGNLLWGLQASPESAAGRNRVGRGGRTGRRASRETRYESHHGRRARGLRPQTPESFPGMRSGVRWDRAAPARPSRDRAAARHRRAVDRVIPWSGCVPAEPAAVSPGVEGVIETDDDRQEQPPSVDDEISPASVNP